MAFQKNHYDRRCRTQGMPRPNHSNSLIRTIENNMICTQVHPNTAQGGNGAIETAAVLTNSLVRKLNTTPSALSEEDIEAVFAEVHASRFARAASSLEQGRRTSSISMRDTFPSRLFVHYLLPWFGDRIIMWLAVKHAETGPVVERLPLPCRHGVTLPHDGTVTERRGSKVPWRLGAFGAALFAVFLCSRRSPGSLEFLAAPFKGSYSPLSGNAGL